DIRSGAPAHRQERRASSLASRASAKITCLQHRFTNPTTTGENTAPKTRPDGRYRTPGTPIWASGADFSSKFRTESDAILSQAQRLIPRSAECPHSHRAPARTKKIVRACNSVLPAQPQQIPTDQKILPQKPAQTAATERPAPQSGRLSRIFIWNSPHRWKRRGALRRSASAPVETPWCSAQKCVRTGGNAVVLCAEVRPHRWKLRGALRRSASAPVETPWCSAQK